MYIVDPLTEDEDREYNLTDGQVREMIQAAKDYVITRFGIDLTGFQVLVSRSRIDANVTFHKRPHMGEIQVHLYYRVQADGLHVRSLEVFFVKL